MYPQAQHPRQPTRDRTMDRSAAVGKLADTRLGGIWGSAWPRIGPSRTSEAESSFSLGGAHVRDSLISVPRRHFSGRQPSRCNEYAAARDLLAGDCCTSLEPANQAGQRLNLSQGDPGPKTATCLLAACARHWRRCNVIDWRAGTLPLPWGTRGVWKQCRIPSRASRLNRREYRACTGH